ncbi:MAG: hypothetical protein SFV55_21735 [Haliscomenobacter sp.]|uniref:hypothetical protein n=1 Tax=Haliscomenobacter sp. TaxID=2717303 RepID=UPI0029A2512E|nr:hypothetical protein [Haliscomenobacter sp.]MDX2071066.1 hypothetical protein [Haliscomenobacter sp.]
MDFSTFQESFQQLTPPDFSNPLLLALWHEGRGDWDASHNIAQDVHSKEGSWVHAYLHRKEGDIWNADYWYNRAGRKRPSYGLEQEWREMVEWFLEH